ncbi:MAG: sugar transferase [Planctomycetaceae bacterium]|nr:MAG: sugar transferase [Planctomycetaceae bacterium]
MMIKRLFDILAGLVALVFLSLPMLVIAIWIRLDSPGPALFRQRRAGWRGEPFSMLKFRTMRINADPYGNSPQAGDDPRLTRIGRRLRELSLDELPQLFNIIGGSMSFVGPRPLYERQAELWDQHQRRRLDVRPGLTGYAQVYGRAALTHEEKIELDVYYVDNRSFWLDLKLIALTAVSIFRGRAGIYEQRYSRHQERETHRKP